MDQTPAGSQLSTQLDHQARGDIYAESAAIRSLEFSFRLALQRPEPNHVVWAQKRKVVVCAKAGVERSERKRLTTHLLIRSQR